jgi:hypothetical protein
MQFCSKKNSRPCNLHVLRSAVLQICVEQCPLRTCRKATVLAPQHNVGQVLPFSTEMRRHYMSNDIPTARSQLRRFDRLAFAAAAGGASACASPMLTRSSGAIPAIKESRNACRSSSFLMSACWSVLYCSTCMHSHADVGGSTAGTPSIFVIYVRCLSYLCALVCMHSVCHASVRGTPQQVARSSDGRTPRRFSRTLASRDTSNNGQTNRNLKAAGSASTHRNVICHLDDKLALNVVVPRHIPRAARFLQVQ